MHMLFVFTCARIRAPCQVTQPIAYNFHRGALYRPATATHPRGGAISTLPLATLGREILNHDAEGAPN